ncbi:hypothetical protein RN001_006292 [Aquatica leii]|uniref:tRNA (32-2'-O)-methyltransferase regulator THADA n=1 Tax=Aquatica leii TaxID=1421715 RepID=A0AAN7SQ61_9COLE|nr:hypothetical protein RN001_006292 [Aquatica leii]
MKQKKIIGPVPQFSIRKFCNSNNSTINEMIMKCSDTTDFTIQQECIKIFAGFLKPDEVDDYESVLKVLAFIYVSCTAKHPIKKSLTRILLPVQEIDLARCLSDSIKHYLEIINYRENLNVAKDEFFNSLYTSFELNAFTLAVLENVNLLFHNAVDFLTELNALWKQSFRQSSSQDMSIFIYNTTKFLLCLLQKCIISHLEIEYRLKLIQLLHEIIIYKEISFEVKCNCGHMIILLFANLPTDFSKESIVPDYAYLDFLIIDKKYTATLEQVRIIKIPDDMLEMFQICVFIGIIIVAPGEVLYNHKINDKTVLSFMLHKLIYSATRTKQNIHRIIGISKALTMLSSHLQSLHITEIENVFNEYLEYLNIYIDNVPDVVKNNSLTILKNLIKAAEMSTKKGYNVIKIIMDWFKNLSRCSSFYTVMVTLSSEIGCKTIFNENPDLVKHMLDNLSIPANAANILNSFEKLMSNHRKDVQSKTEWIDYWAKEILSHLQKSSEPDVFINLFVAAFKVEPDCLSVLTQDRMLQTDSELLALLGCIHFVRRTGLPLDMSNYLSTSEECWRQLLDYKVFDVLKTHLHDEIRILTLGVIVDSHSSTEVFTEWELNYLVDYLYYNINVPNANFRQKLVSYSKKIMQRLNDVIVSHQNKIETANKCKQHELKEKLLLKVKLVSVPILNYYSRFWESLFNNVLLPGLYPDSNYLRKSTSLEILTMSKNYLSKLEYAKLWDDQAISNLKYIVDCDTYEQNKKSATDLLMEFPSTCLNFHTKENISSYIDKCLSLAINIKPMQTISAAYMLNVCLRAPNVRTILLDKLQRVDIHLCDVGSQNQIWTSDTSYLMLLLLHAELSVCLTIAQQNIHEGATSKPIHGLIFCVRHLLNNTNLNDKSKLPHWRVFCHDLIKICLELTAIVNTIVCNDSPEGYLPDDSIINQTDGTATAQMITVYGWRATKEISLLFGDLALNAPFCYGAECEGLIDEQQIMIMGEYFFDLLINTKHRGAFEQASIGFRNLCTRLWRLLDTPVNSLPVKWLETVTSLLLGTHSEGIKSCETRRSAGIPFMVQAILSTEPVSAGSSKNFDSFMKTLLEVGSNETFLAEQRILALNILRALYRHNRLGEMVVPYCAQGVIIAVKGFGCTVWGIRNSATLLFSALVMRIFGVQRLRDTIEVSIKNKMQGQVFFVRYPELFNFLLQELEIASKQKYHSSLYPVLLVLSRLYCNKEALDRSQLDVFLPYVELCLNNPSFKIRELAAQTIPALSELSKLQGLTVNCILKLSDKSLSNNYCHGLLLQFQYLLRLQRNTLCVLNIEKIVTNTIWILDATGENIHHITATLYLEIVLYCITRYDPKFANMVVFHKIMKILMCQEDNWSCELSLAKKYNEFVFTLKLAYILHIRSYGPETCIANPIVYKSIVNGDLKNRSGILNLSLCYLNYIEFTSPHLKDFNLFEEEFEFSQMCEQFLKPLSYDVKLFLYEFLLDLVIEIVMEDVQSNNYAIDTLLLHKLPTTTMDSIRHFLSENNNKYIHKRGDDYGCLVIAHLHKLLSELDDSQLSNVNFDQYLRVLLKFTSPTSDSFTRLAVAKFVVLNKRLFYHLPQILSNDQVRALWEIVFALLEDDDEDVRKSICLLCKDEFQNEDRLAFISQVRVDIPEYSRSKLLKQMILVLPRNDGIEILLSHIFHTNSITNDNLSEVFEEGALNAYVELWPSAKIAIKQLYCIFENENKTNAELNGFDLHTLIATDLYKILCNKSTPFIPTPTKNILCNIFKQIMEGNKCFHDYINHALTNLSNVRISERIILKMFLNKMCPTNFHVL